ncbi:ABC transporter ATP-binding protein [Thermococcus sp. M39]|uniref:ABC transporter ATP-binding protein n=1 Tax=unclassified Thermococcus TaxID=2627626 RepID=UPI001439E82E|nr:MULTISPECIES: ABC transporter ATP-binding protein [unclassified Thermococcus]NJE07335.1 ABC transporter ATP-binding protein [Thermococcus sp. M39]NJE12534.1 ABC transporter ATP-binding protein [Thermococcus sp. LS2]
MYVIETKGLTKVYDDFVAVDHINLKVKRNSIFGFLGPNGAGKTTTVLMLLGLIQPTEGKAYVNGIDVQENPIEVKKISGYVPAENGLYPNMSAMDNLLFFAKFYRIPPREAEKRALELLDLVGLKDVKNKKVGEFSTGMKQRLALAQALINDPEILFLDEPTSGLDPKGAVEIRNLIKSLKKEGKTIFLTSHILPEVDEVSDSIGIIVSGKLVAMGDKEELKRAFLKEKVRILVETEESLPDLSEFALEVKLLARNKAVLYAKADVRRELLEYLLSKGYTVLDLHLMEPTLEEIFLKVAYGEELPTDRGES